MKKSIVAGIAILFLAGVTLSVAQTTPPAPYITQPANGATVSAPVNVAWNNTAPSYYYTLWRNGNAVSGCVDLPYTTTQCSDSGASGSVTYNVGVCSGPNNASPCTGSSNSVTVTVGSGGGGGPPDAPTNFTNGTPTSTQIPLSWNASANATHYNISREIANSQSWSGLPQQYGTSYTDTGLSPSTTYNYKIEACTSGQGCSGPTYTYLYGVSTVAAPDTTAPSTPTDLSTSGITSSQIVLTWTAATDNVAVTGYQIYRNGTYMFTVTTTNLTETTLSAATTYSYYIMAVDAAGNISSPSATVSAATQSGTASCTTLTLTFQNNKTSYTIGETVTYTYICSPGGTTSLVEVSVLKPDSTITVYNSASGSISQNTLGFGTSNLVAGNYTLRACFTAGCSGGVTASASFTVTSSGSVPPVPANLSVAIANNAGSNSTFNLTWGGTTASITSFRVYQHLVGTAWPSTYDTRDTSQIVSSTQTTLTVQVAVYPWSGYGTYEFKVQACNSAGCSGDSNTANASVAGTSDTQAPTTPTGLGAAPMSSSQINLSWTASTDNVAVTGYKIYRGGTYLLTVTGTSYSNTGLSAGTNYSYYIIATDAAGNVSASSNTANATTLTSGSGDSQAPTTPTGLVATKDVSNEVDLSWTASSDNVGVSFYHVYRSQNAVWSYIGQSSNTTYIDLTVSPSTSYYYAVKAYDAAGYYSATSSPLFLNTPAAPGGSTNTSPPPSPTNFAAYFVTNGSYGSSTNLSWSDVSNETSYNVFERLGGSTAWILAKIRTSFTGLVDAIYAANTVSVQVRAYLSGTYDYKVSACNTYGCSDSYWVNVAMGGSTTNTTTTSTTWTQIAPSNLRLSGTPSTSGIPLAWNDNSSGEDKFNIERQISGGGFVNAFLAQLGANVTSYTDTTASAGVYYDYRVQACRSGDGCTDYAHISGVSTSGMVSTTTANTTNNSTDTLPPTLTSLFVGEVAATGAKILWNTNEPANSWVWWGTSSSNYTNKTDYRCDAGGLVTSHCVYVNGLSANTLYYIRAGSADAVGNFGESLGSFKTASTITTTTGSIPNAPSNFRLIPPPSTSQIAIAWNDNSTIEDKYNIERKVSGGDYAGSFLIQIGANATSYTDSTALHGTYYDYRAQACRSGYGCSSYVYLIGVSTPETAGKTSETASTTLVSGSASVSVIRGSAYCDGFLGKTPFTLSVMPYGAAFFKMTMFSPTSASTIITPGTYTLPNGSYRWEAVPYTGYTLSGKTSEDFKLEQYCSGTTSTTTTTTLTNLALAPETTTQTFKPYIVLNGDMLMHMPYGGTYNEPGAKGYMTPDGAAVAPKRLLGGLDPMRPGTYTVTYQLLNSSGSVVASMTRTVIVDPPPVVETQTTETVFETTTYVPSVETVATQEQYARYCDDPKHELECQAYANQKITTTETTLPSTGVTQEQFTAVSTQEVAQGITLPTAITDAKQLNAVCSQSAYVETCTGFLVNQGVLSKEEAASQVKQVFAQAEEVTKIFTERTGARAFEDTDNDGITNYDEVNIYKTDPNKADTNGDGTKDGEQLLSGEDPLAQKVAPPVPLPGTPVVVVPEKKVTYEDPRFAGNVKKDIFVAPTVTAEQVLPPKETPEAAPTAKITLGGRALPNSFVTIYIFSEPVVVTVKTDASGDWTYTLDTELPDGTHEVYSAITDTSGRILAKSEPLPFVKTAAAVSIGSPLLAPSNQAPGFFAGGSLYVLIVVLIGILGLAVSIVGFVSGRNKEGGGGAPPTSTA